MKHRVVGAGQSTLLADHDILITAPQMELRGIERARVSEGGLRQKHNSAQMLTKTILWAGIGLPGRSDEEIIAL